MQKITFSGKTLSPVHIGTGIELEPLEYVVTKEGLFYKIKLEEILENLSDHDRKEFYNLINKNSLIEIRKFISSKFIKDPKHSYYSVDVTSNFQKHYSDKKDDINNQVIIYPFIREQRSYRPYIPGSSLKGVIRTAFLNSQLLLNLSSYPALRNERKASILEGKLLNYHYTIERHHRLEDKTDIKKDPFRVLKISDIMLPKDSTIVSMLYNKRLDRYEKLSDIKRGIPFNCEVTKSLISDNPVEFRGELVIDFELMRKNYNNKRWIKKDITIEELIKSLNYFYGRKLYYDDDRFFKDSGAGEWSLYSQRLIKEFESFDKSREALVRMGKHSGFESITLDEVRRTKQGKNKSNSKTICEDKYPMGWIKITFN